MTREKKALDEMLRLISKCETCCNDAPTIDAQRNNILILIAGLLKAQTQTLAALYDLLEENKKTDKI